MGEKQKEDNSFLGSIQLFIACSTEATKSWVGPGNELLNNTIHAYIDFACTSFMVTSMPV